MNCCNFRGLHSNHARVKCQYTINLRALFAFYSKQKAKDALGSRLMSEVNTFNPFLYIKMHWILVAKSIENANLQKNMSAQISIRWTEENLWERITNFLIVTHTLHHACKIDTCYNLDQYWIKSNPGPDRSNRSIVEVGSWALRVKWIIRIGS